MKPLFGLICVFIIIYGLYLLFTPAKEPEVYELEQDTRETLSATLPAKGEALFAEIEEENKDEDGFFSGAKDYLLSALKDYEEILKSDKDNRGGEVEDGDSSQKNKFIAISIYEEILGFSDEKDVGDE